VKSASFSFVRQTIFIHSYEYILTSYNHHLSPHPPLPLNLLELITNLCSQLRLCLRALELCEQSFLCFTNRERLFRLVSRVAAKNCAQSVIGSARRRPSSSATRHHHPTLGCLNSTTSPLPLGFSPLLVSHFLRKKSMYRYGPKVQ